MTPTPLAIVAALDAEIRPLLSGMEVDARIHVRPALVTQGTYHNRTITVVRSGVGPTAMAKAARYLFEQLRPAFCLHVGCCGGADPQLQLGDLVIATAVADAATGERFAIDEGLIARAHAICKAHGLSAKSAAIVTVDQAVPTPHEKAFVGTANEAQAIDMESAALVAACRTAQVPHLVVRAILDPLDMALPPLGDALEADGSVDGVALAGHLISHPKDLFDLPRLSYAESRVRTQIAAFIDAWIAAPEGV